MRQEPQERAGHLPSAAMLFCTSPIYSPTYSYPLPPRTGPAPRPHEGVPHMAGVCSRGLFSLVPSNTNIKTFPLVLRHPFTIERSGTFV